MIHSWKPFAEDIDKCERCSGIRCLADSTKTAHGIWRYDTKTRAQKKVVLERMEDTNWWKTYRKQLIDDFDNGYFYSPAREYREDSYGIFAFWWRDHIKCL
jgi:hypothetical protein